jgi:hypothetical protein
MRAVEQHRHGKGPDGLSEMAFWRLLTVMLIHGVEYPQRWAGAMDRAAFEEAITSFIGYPSEKEPSIVLDVECL